MIDSFGRDITYARVSLTDRCNLRCQYCMPPGGLVHKKDCTDILRYEDILQIIEVLAQLGIHKVRFTGGEPLVRSGVVPFLERACKIEGIKEWAVTTNALTLERDAIKLRRAGIDRLNISLDTLDAEQYREITRGGSLTQALRGLEAAQKAGFNKIKINTVLMRGVNEDQLLPLAELTRQEDIDVRFIELMPVGSCSGWAQEHFLSAAQAKRMLPALAPVHGDIHAPAALYRLAGGIGNIGFITPLSCSFCENCNRVRITADGRLKTCLHSDEETDLVPALGDRTALAGLIRSAVSRKAERHLLQEHQYIVRNMSQIGG